MSKKKPWSSYWLGSTLDRFERTESEAERLIQLSNIRRGIANFVNILTGKNIPVRFSTGQKSYTDGASVVVISPQGDPEAFDAQVGRALHEATHIIRSQALFAVAKHMQHNPLRYIDGALLDAGLKLNRDTKKVRRDLHLLLNFLEDRRNDQWGYRQAPGYQPYYDAHYEQSFYSEIIDFMLQHPMARIPALKIWELHILDMFNPNADPDALPGLRKIWEIVDLPNIERYDGPDGQWAPWEWMVERHAETPNVQPKNGVCFSDDELPAIVVDARNILRIIYDNAVLVETKDGEDMNDFGTEDPDNLDPPDEEDGSGKGEDGDEEGDEEEDGEDDGDAAHRQKMGPPQRMSEKELKKELKRALKRQERETLGETKKKESLTEEMQDKLNHIESSDAKLREISDPNWGDARCKVIVYKHVTEDTMRIEGLGFNNNAYGVANRCRDTEAAIREGKILGNLLAHKIRIMNDEGIVRVTRQKQGRFDKRLAASIAADNENLFFKSHTAQIEPVMVDLSIDASGSMAGEKWRKAMALSIALAVAASKIRSFRIRINVRASWNDIANVGVVYDSKRDSITKIDTLFPFLWPAGSTPEGLCYDAMQKELLEEIKQTRRFFVNLSDGEPYFAFKDSMGYTVSYYGRPACLHTKRQVDKMRNIGVHILSFFIGGDYYGSVEGLKEQFQMMYGKDAAIISPSDVTAIAFRLNKLFLGQ